jgi:hypothetical protein
MLIVPHPIDGRQPVAAAGPLGIRGWSKPGRLARIRFDR